MSCNRYVTYYSDVDGPCGNYKRNVTFWRTPTDVSKKRTLIGQSKSTVLILHPEQSGLWSAVCQNPPQMSVVN